ncbi:hypothetical protein P3X46_020658 [Hevea brasiliensis]|uniref:Chromo domain-containing protein n=1 Tax=Hevea brasiliensis TaxID=3981 RepID=A0ABQ9LMJ3_HEVBR|nr:hypothetical protein P3X46_020658 [Hevea brasiliensis]
MSRYCSAEDTACAFLKNISSATNKSPFEIVSGKQPLAPHTLDGPYTGRNPKAYHFMKEWKQRADIARARLEKASKPQEFTVGDLVMVKLLPEQLRFLRNRDSRLVQKYEGPMPIVAKVGQVSYKVEPPAWMKIHPVFHVSRLKPYHADPIDVSRNKSSRPAITTAPPVNQGVEEILAERVVRTTKRPPHKEYLIKWKGLSTEETSWEKATELHQYVQKIEDFLQAQSTRTSTIRVGENVKG